jgi:hypothetical protein
VFDPFLESVEFHIEVLQSQVIGFFLVLEQHEGAFLVEGGFGLLVFVQIRVGFLFHVVEHFFIQLFQAGSQLLVLFPNLGLVHLVVVG